MPRLVQLNIPQQQQIQRLILSPQMQQALHILQLPVLELRTKIEEAVANNPLLEEETPPCETPLWNNEITYDEGGNRQTILENTVACEVSLYDYLMQQAYDLFADPQERAAAEWLIGNFDANGWLTSPLEELALLGSYSLSYLDALLKKIQTFDPAGVGARSQQESLLIQLRLGGKEETVAFRIIESHYDDLLHHRLPAIAKSLSHSVATIDTILKEEIGRLDLHPGTNYGLGHYPSVIPYITPDLLITIKNGILIAETNEDPLPRIRFNTHYTEWLRDPTLTEETKAYIEEKMGSGKWLLRTLSERSQTLLRIGEALIDTQSIFFLEPNGALSPMIMQDIARHLSLHESTIARAVAHKYVICPRGIFPLRFFFTHAYQTDHGNEVSAQTVKGFLRDTVAIEDKRQPLSDEALSALLQEKGIPCARRTVAKYRQELGIGNTLQRKVYRSTPNRS